LSGAKKSVAKVFVSIGSNIDKALHIPASLAALTSLFGKITVSSVYESEPIGFAGACFYNLVVSFETEWAITDVSQQLRHIEAMQGRIRTGEKFSAHTLDLDLLLYDDVICHQNDKHIPHADIEKYAFVLEPLAEIAPTLTHPVSGINYATLWESFDKTQVKQRRLESSELAFV
jgi:2-amino-4-hydroxy-6-hydroxymethyldihydropteridine diphosphokinase